MTGSFALYKSAFSSQPQNSDMQQMPDCTTLLPLKLHYSKRIRKWTCAMATQQTHSRPRFRSKFSRV